MASQGASNGPSQGAGSQFVKFTRGAAQRIAKVVRTVEAGDRSGPGLTFDHPMHDAGLRLKVATFTGSWETGTWKTVTLTGTTQTATVYNWCNSVGDDSTTINRYVIFGRAGGTNSALEIAMGGTCGMLIGGVDLKQLEGYSAGAVQVLGHNTTGPCLQWYSVTTCATA